MPDINEELEALKAENAKLKEDAAKAAKAADPAPVPPVTPVPPVIDPIAAAQKALVDDKAAKDNVAAIEQAAIFNAGIKDFVKTNEKLLPAESSKLIEIIGTKTYSNSIEKASEIKASLVKSFFALQPNIDILPPSFKSKIEDYLKLNSVETTKQASAAYESLELAIQIKQKEEQAAAAAKANNGVVNPADDPTAEYDKLILSKVDNLYRGRASAKKE